MKIFNLKIGKIIGKISQLCWPQSYVFLAKEKEKKILFGNLLVCFSLTAKKEGVEMASFAEEIKLRFHETYFSLPKLDCFQRIKEAWKVLEDEFSQAVKIEMAVAVILASGKVYFASNGESKIFILRDNHLVKILSPEPTEKIFSVGLLKNGDLVVLATGQFWQLIDLEILKTFLITKQFKEAIELLSSIVKSRQENNKTAAIIFKAKSFSQSFFYSSREFIARAIDFWKKENPIVKIRKEEKSRQRKKNTLTIAFILIILLIISVILGTKRRSFSKDSRTVRLLTTKANSLYEQAISLKEINPLKAKALLIEAKNNLKGQQETIKNEKEKNKIIKWQEKINQEWQSISREYRLNKGEIFLDLTLFKKDFQGSDLDVVANNLYVFDGDKGTVLKVAVDKKSCEIAAGGKKLAGGKFIGAAEKRIFIAAKNKIFVFDLAKEKIIQEIKENDWGKIVDLSGFGNNAYFLDKEKGQIWKYRGIQKGLAARSSYLKTKEDLNQAISLTIDGSVWVLDSQGNIMKFVRGKRDFFNLLGLDKPFNEPIKIYGGKDVDNLYVLDRKNTRVVIIDKKTGEYQAQYIWPGIAGISDLAVFENERKILLLAGNRIYQIEIRE